MQLYCHICRHILKEGEEVMFTGMSYWHELGSKVTYSISTPHHVLKDSLRHSDCEESINE
jgi:hypothetical protein